jgi:hypothetical protein
MRNPFLVLAAVLAVAGCSTDRYQFPEAANADPQAKIGFVQYRGVYTWEAVSDRRLYVQDRGRQWYQVDLFGPCIGLEFTNRVRFIPSDGAGDFDRFSSIQMGPQRCKVESVKKVSPPVRIPKTSGAPAPKNSA